MTEESHDEERYNFSLTVWEVIRLLVQVDPEMPVTMTLPSEVDDLTIIDVPIEDDPTSSYATLELDVPPDILKDVHTEETLPVGTGEDASPRTDNPSRPTTLLGAIVELFSQPQSRIHTNRDGQQFRVTKTGDTSFTLSDSGLNRNNVVNITATNGDDQYHLFTSGITQGQAKTIPEALSLAADILMRKRSPLQSQYEEIRDFFNPPTQPDDTTDSSQLPED